MGVVIFLGLVALVMGLLFLFGAEGGGVGKNPPPRDKR
jgi:hypothetical protein